MSLKKFFNPSSIAIVGVSKNPLKVGHLVAKNMLDAGYKGSLYFVHPEEDLLLGQKTYPSLSAIGKKVDLVVFAVPSHVSVPMLDEVAQIGCHDVVIFAAGFKENHTEDGDALEAQLQEKVKKYNITLLGPNCIGYINTQKKINATFLKQGAPTGNIGIISQSGALGSAIVDSLSAHENMGVSYFISLGNKSAMDESDCLTFLGEDPQTTVIGMYLEDVIDGDKFRSVLTKVAKKKPVVILKGGATSAGSQAAMSHTGSLVGDDQVFESLVSQSFALRVHSYAEFYELLKLYSFEDLPTSRNVLVLSNAGGMGVLLADELVQQNLSLEVISQKTQNKLYKAFNDFKKISIHNPIDLLGDASSFDYQKAIELTIQEKNIGAIIVLLTPQANTEIMETAEVLAKTHKKLSTKQKKPIYPVFMGDTSVRGARKYFETQKMSAFYEFDMIPGLISRIMDRTEGMKSSPGAGSHTFLSLKAHNLDIHSLLMEHHGKDFLNQYDSLKVLEYAGLNTAKTYLATSEKDLEKIIKKEGYPLVAKIASDKITHKTEVKGVITGLNSWDELIKAYLQLSEVAGKKSGSYIQKQFSGHEVILGAKRDHTFGTVVLLGLGGIYAELLHEVSQFVYPFSYQYFETMIMKTKMKKFVEGYRNMPKLDLHKLYESALKLGELMERHENIKEIDINPFIISEESMIVVDGRIILDQTASG